MTALPGRSGSIAARLAACVLLAPLALAVIVWLGDRMQEATGFAGGMAAFPDYLTALSLAFVLAVGIAAWPVPGGDRMHLLLLWGVKAMVTLFLLPVYEAHYDGVLDAYMYFRVGALRESAMPPLEFGQGTSVIIWLTHWVTRIVPSYFHLLEMLWSFVGLLGIFAFYRGWRRLVPQLDSRFLLWLGLFPGILFWTSIFGKDPICLLGVGLYFYGVARWYAAGAVRGLWLTALGIFIATSIRPWYAVILLVPLVAFAVVGRRMRGWQKALLFAAVATSAVIATQAFLSAFNINDVSSLVATSNQVSHSWSLGGSAQVTPRFHGLGSVLAFIPFGMFTAFFRPLPGELLVGAALLASLENLVLLATFAIALWRMPLRALRRPWLVWLVLLLLLWGAMYAFPSSQNLGTAVRFKVEMMPVLWPLLLLGATSRFHWGLVPLRSVMRSGAVASQRARGGVGVA